MMKKMAWIGNRHASVEIDKICIDNSSDEDTLYNLCLDHIFPSLL